MKPRADRLFSEALKLPVKKRAELVGLLAESLEGSLTDADYEAAWSEEIGRRIRELETGAVKAIPWSEARRRILKAAHGAAKT
jgi:putative addiction module component (TIGR02574 family)